MKLLAMLAFAVVAMASLAAEAATFQYKISNSPANAFTRDGGLSGHKIFAGIEGTFAITYESGELGGSVVLSQLDLHLVNVTENFDLPHFDIGDLEGTPIQDYMSHDLEGSPVFGVSPANAIQFATPQIPTNEGVIVTEPYSWMGVEFEGADTTVRLFTRLTPLTTIDGPTVTFLPLTATPVPEPASVALAGVSLLSLAALRRRK